MHRTQVLLESDQYEKLKEVSAASGTSIGAIVRAAVGAYLSQQHASQNESLEVLADTQGAWRDRDFADGTEYVERSRKGMAQRLAASAWD